MDQPLLKVMNPIRAWKTFRAGIEMVQDCSDSNLPPKVFSADVLCLLLLRI
jgi:hypothetical protein